MSRATSAALLFAAGLLLAPEASAHSPFPGIKGLYTGFLHPLTQPAQALLLIALSLLLATHPHRARPAAAGALTLASLAGVIAGALAAPAQDATLLIALVIGTSVPVLLQLSLSGWMVIGLAAAGGCALGLACAPDPGDWQEVAITSLGSWLGLAYFAAMITGATVAACQRWPGQAVDVGLRIVAAWLIAIGVLYVTLLWYLPATG